MSILHDMWTKDELDEELKNTYHYVFDLRSTLENSAKLASAKHRSHFDKEAKSSVLSGDEVLVLYPSSHNKLKMEGSLHCVEGT